MLFFRGVVFPQNHIIFWFERTHKDQVQLLSEWCVHYYCLMEFVLVHHLHFLLGYHVVSHLGSVESHSRDCISLALPLAGLKPVLREIRSTAHFILNGGSVGFSPVTLAKSLTAFYLSLTSFKWMDQCLPQESCDDKFIAFEALQKFVNDEQLYIKDYCSFMLILQFYSCWHSSWSLLLLTLACQEFRILSPTY